MTDIKFLIVTLDERLTWIKKNYIAAGGPTARAWQNAVTELEIVLSNLRSISARRQTY